MRIAGVCVALVAAFALALVAGKASGGDDDADASTEVKVVKSADKSMRAPKLAGTGSIPDLHEPPAPAATPTTSSTPSSSDTSSSAPATSGTTAPSTGGGGGGDGGGGGGGPVAPPPG
jgi:uncharacterized membrane protein YgcG